MAWKPKRPGKKPARCLKSAQVTARHKCSKPNIKEVALVGGSLLARAIMPAIPIQNTEEPKITVIAATPSSFKSGRSQVKLATGGTGPTNFIAVMISSSPTIIPIEFIPSAAFHTADVIVSLPALCGGSICLYAHPVSHEYACSPKRESEWKECKVFVYFCVSRNPNSNFFLISPMGLFLTADRGRPGQAQPQPQPPGPGGGGFEWKNEKEVFFFPTSLSWCALAVCVVMLSSVLANAHGECIFGKHASDHSWVSCTFVHMTLYTGGMAISVCINVAPSSTCDTLSHITYSKGANTKRQRRVSGSKANNFCLIADLISGDGAESFFLSVFEYDNCHSVPKLIICRLYWQRPKFFLEPRKIASKQWKA